MTVFTTEEREFTVIEEESSEMDLEDEAEECVKVEDDDFVSYWQAGLLFAFFFPIPIFIWLDMKYMSRKERKLINDAREAKN